MLQTSLEELEMDLKMWAVESQLYLGSELAVLGAWQSNLFTQFMLLWFSPLAAQKLPIPMEVATLLLS